MRKRIAKLRLNRETLLSLDMKHLTNVAGGSQLSLCLSDLPGMCNPSNDSECVSRCLECPQTNPSDAC
jgi:hypothetical protein